MNNNLVFKVKTIQSRVIKTLIESLKDLLYEVNFSNDDIEELTNFVYPPISITSEFPHGYSLESARRPSHSNSLSTRF